jgi:hypothetical protein
VTGGGVRLWTQFHNARSIALHEYRPVDGTPLSHGCVRLNRSTAQTIFDGAVTGVTRVTVRNLAAPRCNHTTLQNAERVAPGFRGGRKSAARRRRRRSVPRPATDASRNRP